MRSKPLSGTLQVTIRGARELDHAPIVSFGRIRSSSRQVSETLVSIKVEGTQLARSHPSRTDRWNEDFEIQVEKANEVEIVLYDKQASEHAIPIGLLWVRINDLVEALRRQKVTIESGQGGWVTAGAMPGDSPTGMHQYSSSGDMNAPLSQGGAASGSGMGSGAPTAEGIDAWFAVEPAGAIALRLNFSKRDSTSPATRVTVCDSQGERSQTTHRCSSWWWSRTSGSRSQTKGRSARNEWPQIRSTTILPAHAMRFLQRFLAQRRRIPM